MKAQIRLLNTYFTVDLSLPMNISLPINRDGSNPNAYFLPDAAFEPFRANNFVGSVKLGGSVNCECISLAPHGNGTHTECVGHISIEHHHIKDSLQSFFAYARVLSIKPRVLGNDSVVCCEDLAPLLKDFLGDCIVLRTLPNELNKKHRQWSGTNPPYCEAGIGTLLRERGIKHFLLDLPSVDREEDGGVLAVHHEFWNYPHSPRLDATITEMIYVPDEIADGEYLLQFSTLALQSDASPSQVLLYSLLADA